MCVDGCVYIMQNTTENATSGSEADLEAEVEGAEGEGESTGETTEKEEAATSTSEGGAEADEGELQCVLP